MKPVRLLAVCCLCLLAGCNLASTVPTPIAQNSPELVIAYVEQGNLLVWQSGDSAPRRVASGGVVRPYVAPDGKLIAFTRGGNRAPEALWAVGADGNGETELVGSDPRERTYQLGENQIGDVAWYNDTVLYFNSLQIAQPSYMPRNDLYRVNAQTREMSLILPQGEGGRFAFSPDKQHIAVVSGGTYGRQDGAIRVIDPLAQKQPTNLLFYIGVASGSHLAFYPSLFWSADSANVYAVIADADLIYSEQTDDVPPTRLWQLPIDAPSQRAVIGSFTSSFFGLPALNPSSNSLFYLQRIPQSNSFALITDTLVGDNPVTYTEGSADTLAFPTWLDDTRFIYTQNTAGEVYIGTLGQTPQRLNSDPVYQPLFVSADSTVFISDNNGTLELRYSENANTQTIATVSELVVFDAVKNP
jgi:hypothetical protein